MPPTQGFELAQGTLFNDRYQIVRRISEGGMGAVYEAIHLDTRRRRALKLMRPELLADAGARARFKLEAQVAAEIESEHIVEVVDAGIDPATSAPFIVMELLRGEDLGSALARRGKLPPIEVVDALAQAARALDRTHAAGIVHRDLKPENLFLSQREDGTARVKVLDFGIAKVVEESRHQTRATASIGTPVFMAPEQISGAPISPLADVYALGHIAFTLLTGAPYWDVEASAGNVYSLLVKIAAGAPEPALARAESLGVKLPRAFEGWFARVTAVAAVERYRSAGEAVIELAKALDVEPPVLARAVVISGPQDRLSGPSGPTGYGATLPSRGRAPGRRWSLFAAVLGVTIVGLVAVGIHVLSGGRGAVGAETGAVASTGSAVVFGGSPPPTSAPAVTTGPSGSTQAPIPGQGISASAEPPRVEPAPPGARSATTAGSTPAATTSAEAGSTASAGPKGTGSASNTASTKSGGPPSKTAVPTAGAPPPSTAAAPAPPSNPLLTR